MHRQILDYLLAISLLLMVPEELSAQAATRFSPKGGVKDLLIQNIEEARTSIDVAAFQLTSGDLAEALLFAKYRGVRVRLLLDYWEAQKASTLVPFLKEQGIEIKLAQGRLGGQMHHTFIIFDFRKVFTGSYSLTEYAEKFNYENALFLDDPLLAAKYLARFNELFGEPLEERPPAPLPPAEEKYFIGLSLLQIQQRLAEESARSPGAAVVFWSHCEGMYVRGEGKIVYIYPDLTRVTLDDNGIAVEIITEIPLPPLQEGQKVAYTGRLIKRPSTDEPFTLDNGNIFTN